MTKSRSWHRSSTRGEWLSIEKSNSLHYFLDPVVHSAEHDVSHGEELRLAGIAVLAAAAGAGLAAVLYVRRPEIPDRIASAFSGVYRVVFNKYYVDEIYGALILRPLVWFSDRVLFRLIDVRLIDGAGVNGTASVVRGIADRGLKYLQTGLPQSYMFAMLIGGVVLISYLLGVY